MAGNVLSHITCSERQITDGPQVLELGALSPSASHLRIFHGSLTRRFLAAILYISALSKKRPSYLLNMLALAMFFKTLVKSQLVADPSISYARMRSQDFTHDENNTYCRVNQFL